MAICLAPITVREKLNNVSKAVPCGKCPECKKSRASKWSWRLSKHETYQDNAHFVTLTYDTDNVRITNNGYMTVKKRDAQLFLKRVRHYMNKWYKKNHVRKTIRKPISYYLTAEYGEEKGRPHYHAIIFNVTKDAIAEAWKMGEIHLGDVSGASIGYTLKYISKESWKRKHKNHDVDKPFSIMSKGIGKDYVTPAMIKYHKADLTERMFATVDNKVKIGLPRYIKEKIYDEREIKQLSKHFEREAENKLREEIDKVGDYYIHSREQNELKKQSFYNDKKLKNGKRSDF